jgi:DNA-binding NarL/FixJ family response regulator
MKKPAESPLGPRTSAPNFDSIQTVQSRERRGVLRVLIADDYEAVRAGLCALLESVDIEVCAQAQNGEEAVEKSIQLRPDLIILDISMPGLGGIEAARRIRAFLPEVPILFFTTHDTPQLFAIAKAVGAQGFVTKDRVAATLLNAVDALLKKQTFFNL